MPRCVEIRGTVKCHLEISHDAIGPSPLMNIQEANFYLILIKSSCSKFDLCERRIFFKKTAGFINISVGLNLVREHVSFKSRTL